MLREKQGFSRKGAGGFTPIYSRKCQKLGESDPSRRRRKGKQVTSGGRRRRERSQADPWLLCLCLQEEATAPTGWSGQGAGEPIPQPSAGLGQGAEGKVSNGPRAPDQPGVHILGLGWKQQRSQKWWDTKERGSHAPLCSSHHTIPKQIQVNPSSDAVG